MTLRSISSSFACFAADFVCKQGYKSKVPDEYLHSFLPRLLSNFMQLCNTEDQIFRTCEAGTTRYSCECSRIFRRTLVRSMKVPKVTLTLASDNDLWPDELCRDTFLCVTFCIEPTGAY